MLDRIPTAVSVGAESKVLIAESLALWAWAGRMHADMELTIEASRRLMREARKLLAGSGPCKPPSVAPWP